VVSKYYFPNDVVSYTESFLNDIVLDENKEIAYLTDAWGDGGLIVYNYQKSNSRRYSGSSTMADPNYVMIINGVNYGTDTFTTPVDGIAITDDNQAIFYCSVQGDELFRLPTAILNDFNSTQDQITAEVQSLGFKEPSDGIQYWNGLLYYGSLPESTYYALPVTATSIPYPDAAGASVPVWPEQVDFRWIDTFSLDLSDSTKIWFVSNSLDLFFSGTMDFTGSSGNSNFRVISTTSTSTASTSSDNDDNKELQNYKISLGIIVVLLVLCAATLGLVLFRRPKQKESLLNQGF
jgi:hypothetical protein